MSYFNSTKVQFGGLQSRRLLGILAISIPLRYNLELLFGCGANDISDFNSTKVQFGAVKLDRKYHINKGFEKRFR